MSDLEQDVRGHRSAGGNPRRPPGLALVTRALLTLIVIGAVLLTGCSCGSEDGGPSSGASLETTAGVGTPVTEITLTSVAATLLQVIDGDTIRVRMSGGREEKVRYIGIDAPELAHADAPGEYLGEEATAHNAALLTSGPLRLQTDVDERDDFGRLLAYVWAGEVFVNERMVRDGYARARDYPPNLALQDRLWEAQDEAREAGIGIWSR